MDGGASIAEGYDEPLRLRLTAMLRRVDEPMYIGLVEQGDVEPLDGDECRKPGWDEG